MTVCCRFDLVSTVGDSPVTVIVSATVADFEFRVDRRGECSVHADAGPLDGPEALKLELDDVIARREPVEAVSATCVGDHCLDTADQPVASQRH